MSELQAASSRALTANSIKTFDDDLLTGRKISSITVVSESIPVPVKLPS